MVGFDDTKVKKFFEDHCVVIEKRTKKEKRRIYKKVKFMAKELLKNDSKLLRDYIKNSESSYDCVKLKDGILEITLEFKKNLDMKSFRKIK